MSEIKTIYVVYDGTPTRIQGKGYRELTELLFTLSRNNFFIINILSKLS